MLVDQSGIWAFPCIIQVDKYLSEHILYSLGYQKGHYVYRCDAPGINNDTILSGNASLEALVEPIGIPPDFALLCNVKGYDVHYGKKGNIVFNTFRITMTLYDLKEKKAVWTGTTEGISARSVLARFLEGRGLPFLIPDKISTALMKAVDTMPSVKGFRRGSASKY